MERRVVFVLVWALASVATVSGAFAAENGEVVLGHTGGDAELGAATAPLLVVIDTPYQVFDDAGTLVHVAAWAPDGRPAARADVFLADAYLGQTDDTGSFAFRWGVPGNELEDYWTGGSRVSVRWSDDDVVRGGDVWFSAMSRTESFAADHLYVYTDRGVYAPGDTLNARLLAWHLSTDYAPVDGASVELRVVAPNGQTVVADAVETDAFGTGAASLPLAETLAEGLYTLEVIYGDARAEHRVRVERFVPPVISITHDAPRFLTRDQDAYGFDASLSYAAGGVPRGAGLVVEALSDGVVRHRAAFDASGGVPVHVSLGAAALEAWTEGLSDRQRIALRLTATDERGRVDTVTWDLTYVANPYITIIETDRDAWAEGDPVELVVRLTDIERVPVRERAIQLRAQDGRTWSATTDTSGTAHFTLQMGGEGFEVAAYIEGVDAPLQTRWLDWREPQPMRSHVPEAVVREEQETPIVVTFPADFRPAEDVVHVDVTDSSGSIVNALLLPIRQVDGAYIAEGTVSAPSWGSMLLTLFCLGERTGMPTITSAPTASSLGLLTEGQNLVVHPNRELQIVLDGLPDEVAPGDAFTSALTVRDASGARVDAAVGLAMVDRSVISMRDPLQITPMDHFYNPELRVISTTGSAILTWPVVSRNWGGRTHDVALPPFGYLEHGPVASTRGDVASADLEEAEAFDNDGSQGFGGATVSGSGMAMAAPAPAAVGTIALMQDAPAPEPGAGRSRSRGERAAAEPEIHIRTEQPATAWWAPAERARDGRLTIEARAPESISTQQLAIVASDGRGGVGVHRVDLRVTQPLTVRSELPATLLRGERTEVRVSVQNLGDTPRDVELRIRSEELTIDRDAARVHVLPGERAWATFTALGEQAGDARFVVSALAPDASDAAEHTLFVAPGGEAGVETSAGRIDTGTWATRLPEAVDAEWRETSVRVLFPSLTTAFAEVDALMATMDQASIDTVARDLVTAILLGERRGDALEPGMRATIQAALTRVEAAQRADGGWGVWWSEGLSPMVTGWCVEALTTGRAAGYAVSDDALRRGVSALLPLFDVAADGASISVEEVAFWEGDTAAVRRGLAMELLHAMARVPAEVLGDDAARVADAVRAAAAASPTARDPMADAHLLGARVRLAADGRSSESAETLRAAAQRLAATRDEGHWEPSWFNAYGGTIEANVVILEVLAAVDGELAERVRRDALRSLLSTRDGFGDWHNPRGSAWLARALAMFDAPAPDAEPTPVSIWVDDERVVEVTLDPSDPYLSAGALRLVDISARVRGGARAVEVRYDGVLAPRVEVVDRVWR